MGEVNAVRPRDRRAPADGDRGRDELVGRRQLDGRGRDERGVRRPGSRRAATDEAGNCAIAATARTPRIDGTRSTNGRTSEVSIANVSYC